MTLLFTAQGLSGEIWTEREQGTLRRIASTPAGLSSFVAGRTLAFGVLLGTIAIVAVAAAALLVGIPVARPVLAVAWIVFAGSVLYLLMTYIQMFAGSARTGGLVTSILVLPLAMVGGGFFPFEIMPKAMAEIGRMTPNGLALELFKGLLRGEAAPARIAQAFGAAALLIAALTPLVVGRLRTRFIQS